MSIAEALIDCVLCESTEYKWKKTPDGYELADGAVKIVREGKMFYLVIPNLDIKKSLGKKATFDVGNRALDKVLNKK